MGALSAATAPATFDSSAYLGALLEERTKGRMSRDRDDANEQFRRAVRERIRLRARQLDYNRDRMAQKLGLTAQGYAKWEREFPNLERLTDLAEILEVSPEWILHGDSPQLADLQAQLEAVSGQVKTLLRLVTPPESDQETGSSPPA